MIIKDVIIFNADGYEDKAGEKCAMNIKVNFDENILVGTCGYIRKNYVGRMINCKQIDTLIIGDFELFGDSEFSWETIQHLTPCAEGIVNIRNNKQELQEITLKSVYLDLNNADSRIKKLGEY